MKKRSGFCVMKQLMGLVKPLAGFMVLAVGMGLAGHLAASFITILGGYAVLILLGIKTPFTLKLIFVSVCIFALFRGILRYAEQSCNHYIAFKLLALIRDRVFYALRRLCPAKLDGREKGDLIAMITSDVELLEVFYAHTISPVAIAVLFSGILSLFIGSFHWLLGVIALAAYLTVGIAVPLITAARSGETGIRLRNSAGKLSGFVLDSLRGLPETLQYGQEKERLAKMNAMTDRLSVEERNGKRIQAQNQAVTNTVMLTFDLIMLCCTAILYQKGMTGFDGVLIPVIALMSSYGPVVALANLGSTLQNTFAAGNRILDILEESPVVEEVHGMDAVEFMGADACGVSFSYDKEKILDQVSLEIPKGSIVGIIGRSGSGKSTLLKLFMRFWDAGQGQIIISGRDIRKINTKDLRNMESLVSQETHLFHDSIRNNLRIAKPDASDEEIQTACKKASVHDFIMSLPDGYNTPVGELGDTLSGGERQRLGLARAFLHDADLLLLDEPTSNLDSLNEAVILRALREEKENKTVMLVSHRISTMRITDQTYSVEHGRIS